MPRRLNKPPELYTLAPHSSFVDGLVQGIHARYGDDPLTLSDVLILLPNRRAVRSLRDAFLRHGGGKSLLLPRIEPIGDVDEDDLFLSGNMPQGTWDMDLAPPIPAHMRQMLLMDIIGLSYRKRNETPPDVAQSAILAHALGQFLDQVQTEELTFRDLEKLVPSAYATHWQKTLDFLKILTEHWPNILATTGFSDVAARRNILLEGLREKWLASPPQHPIIAAGSTGSIPATASLLGVISRLPKGMVLLPGLDLSMDAESWDLLDDTHPQATMKQLLSSIGTTRDVVENWLEDGTVSPDRLARNHMLREVMRPAETTDRWRSLDLDLTVATKGFARLDAPGPREEAGMIALMLREALETEGKTAALVTSDRQLARRVAGEMKRWNILIDDSAGIPLANSAPGVYLRLTASMVGEGLAPVALLSVLKHPLSAGGQAVGDFRRMVRLMEEYILRGPRPGTGCEGISRALAAELKAQKSKKYQANQKVQADLTLLQEWWQGISHMIQPFEQIMQQTETSFEDLLVGHIEMVEKLCASSDRSGPERLWRGDAGEVAAKLIEDLYQAAPYLPRLSAENYPALLEVFMTSITVRPKYGQHPRLNIWSPLEARLQHADLVILAALNEGNWPPEPLPDPWMSRPMRHDFGLPSLERKIGLSAHDFIQAASAPQVVLTRSKKVDGTPTVKSRWLSRMDAIAPEIAEISDISQWLDRYRALDKPMNKQVIDPPRPTPPVAVRPRKLSVTRIEKWMQDPYSIYARYILNFKTLDPLDADPGAADKGTIIHDALDDFMTAYADKMPENGVERLLEFGRARFENYLDRPQVRAFWWPRFIHVAEWFVAEEQTRRQSSRTVATEITAKKDFDLAGGLFTLTAKADRIDLLSDGSYSIIDYKTGQSPTARALYAGYAPQLPLEGLMAEGGNFKGLAAGPVSDLSYWQLKGGEDVAKITAFNVKSRSKMDVPEVIKASFEGLVRLVTTFDMVETPYLNNPRPDNLGYGEYDHLARTKEWQGNDLGEVDPLLIKPSSESEETS
ncbi:MAG: double-strand break repair protein AddB [Emcibacter sp.]|nr:double-strand break repair protein AddB [Emcibacter sp.]